MYSIDNSISLMDLGIACIVLVGYISGKLWMYYNTNNEDKRGTKRGSEWPE